MSAPSDIGNGFLIWLLLTADQPVVGLASSVFDGGEPGTNAFELFPILATE